MKKLLTLALVLSSCVYHDIKVPCDMVASKANPIELWPIDEETYNEVELCGVHKDCFALPFECDDIIKIQFQGDSSDYEVVIIDTAGNYVSVIAMNKTGVSGSFTFTNEEFFVTMPPWESFDPAPAFPPDYPEWTYTSGAVEAGPLVAKPATAWLRQANAMADDGIFPAGDYEVEYSIFNGSSGGSAPPVESLAVRGFDASDNLITPSSVSTETLIRGQANTGTITFSFSVPVNKIGFQVVKNFPTTGSTVEATITYLRLINSPPTNFVHYTEFSFNDPDQCNQFYQVKIRNSETEEFILKSDVLDIREQHDCTVLLEYSNENDYAGLIYEDISPEQSFYLRIPADFWQERPIEEMETHDLSNNKTIALNSEVKTQRLLETDFLPNYMHTKLAIILKHQTLIINGTAYTQTEAYNKMQGNKRFSTKRANVWLLEQNSVIRNTM